MRPLVLASCDVDSAPSSSSDKIFSVTLLVFQHITYELFVLTGQALAELHAPLVEAVDVPDGALSECEVFVVHDQSSQSSGGDLVGKDGCGGPVSEEGLVGNESLGGALCFDLLRCLADHECFRLGEEVGRKHSF
jgi:hypothetical protein